jgi:hypothetical protein
LAKLKNGVKAPALKKQNSSAEESNGGKKKRRNPLQAQA